MTSALLLAGAGRAQPSLTYSKHGLTPGNVHTTRQVDYAEPGDGGSAMVWDFSKQNIIGGAYAESLGEGTLEGKNISVTHGDATFFFNVTPSGNEYFGHKTSGYSWVYEVPILKAKYPFSYLDEHSGTYYGHIAQNGKAYTAIDGEYSSAADAYGTLILPNGKVFQNVLRVKTTDVRTEFTCNSLQIEEAKYLWYTQELRYPAFITLVTAYKSGNKINSSKTSFVSVEAMDYVASTQIAEEIKEEETPTENVFGPVTYKVFPTVIDREATVAYKLDRPLKVFINVYDLKGSLVAKLVDASTQSEGFYTYSYTPGAPGTYFVKMNFGNRGYTEQVVKR